MKKLLKILGVPSPVIGQRILWGTDGDTIIMQNLIGVAKDFHFASFKNEIKPFAFVAIPRRAVTNLTVKLSTKNLSATTGSNRKSMESHLRRINHFNIFFWMKHLRNYIKLKLIFKKFLLYLLY